MKIKALLLFIIFIQGCDLFSSQRDLEVKLTLDSYLYSIGDTLTGKFDVKNNSDEDVTFEFTSGCHHGMRIKKANKLYLELPERCAAVISTLYIKSGEKKSYNIRQKLCDRQNQNLSNGRYSVEAYLLNNYSDIALKTIEIK